MNYDSKLQKVSENTLIYKVVFRCTIMIHLITCMTQYIRVKQTQIQKNV